MKRTFKTLMAMVIAVLMLTVATIPALATDFDFEGAIENFTETTLNTKTLEIGETATPLGANWLENPNTVCYISGKEVIEFENGVVTAIGEGTAYIAIVPGSNVYEITCYKVSDKQAASENSLATNSNNQLNKALEDDETGFGSRTRIPGGFSVVAIGIVLFGCFFCFVVVWMIATALKSKKLDKAMQGIVTNPCEATAEAAVKEFSNTNGLLRFNLTNGSDSRGVHFSMWREVFNYTVIPSRNIKTETKEALRNALIRLNTHSLKPVFATQTAAEAKEAAEAFGIAGEYNVWHNLKAMPDCDVYRNVKINNGDTCSEIDTILVSESKGVFLFEVKSIGGITATDGNKVITYNQLKEDPSNQIYRHEYDFAKYFADIDISKKTKNVLVFSWPNQDTRRWVATNTFPQTDYPIITVEQLGGFFRVQPDNPITKAQRRAIATKLKSCSGDSILRNV